VTNALEVFRFEIAYQLRRGSTRVYLLIFLGLALVLGREFYLEAREDGFFFNAPIIIAVVSLISSMVALLVAAGVAGDAATRDFQTRLSSLLYVTPLDKLSYLGGRFLGTFAIVLLLVTVVPLGLLLATLLPNIQRDLLGAFRPAAYLLSWIMLAVPNAFLMTAVLFSISVITRRAIAAYAGAALLFISSLVNEAFLAARLGEWELGKLLDPLGYTAIRALWRTWNPLQRNTLLVGLDPVLVTNRILWFGVAIGALAFAYSRFRLASESGGRRWGRRDTAADLPAIREHGIRAPVTSQAFGLTARSRQLLAITLHSLRQLVSSPGWLIVPVAAIVFVVTGSEVLRVQLGVPGAATTARIASILSAVELSFLVALLTVVYAGELVWRERDTRMNALADVVPVPEWIGLVGRFLALALMLFATQAVFFGAGVILQATEGVDRFEPALYARLLFGVRLSGHLLFAALAIAIHVLVNQKYVANVLALLAFFATDFARELGVRHNLLLYGSTPRLSVTDMAGFGSQIGPWLWFTLYWSGWALLLGIAGYLFWVRGSESSIRSRLSFARRRLTRWPMSLAVLALATIIGAGGFVFYNTNILNPYRTPEELERWRAEYERRYGAYASLAQPVLSATTLHVDFYPERGAAAIRGSYLLENRADAAIDSIHFVLHPDVETYEVAFDQPSHQTLNDPQLGYRIYALEEPLQPGSTVRMEFEVAFEGRGFTNEGSHPAVIRNGSWIQHRAEQNHGPRQWLPFVGYQTSRELDNPAARTRHGLTERPAVPPLEDVAARSERKGREMIAFEATIGTPSDQMGVAPGHARRTWTEGGRRYAHYVTDAPIRNGYAIFAADYAVHRGEWNDPSSGSGRTVAIEIFHHPSHTTNLERMVRSVEASLDYHTRHFGPYPHRQVRLVEYPSSGGVLGLTSYPGMIAYSEGYALVRADDDSSSIDLPFAVMAHEMAHQWWGNQLLPARVEGAVFTESLAWYSGMMVVEETLGREHLTRLLEVMRSHYLAPHQTRQVPLLRSVETMDAYRTGPFAMYAVRESVGEEQVNAALRRLLVKYDPMHPPYPTSLDLYAELRAVTPEPVHDLLKDLFEEITFWDLRTRNVDVETTDGGHHSLTLHIEAQKLKADAHGRERPVPMNDLIEVGVFDAEGHALYRGKHRIRSGSQAITVVVDGIPARAGLDPGHLLLDREPENNVVALQ
jgi:ABC-2 type transport system permease protein